MADLKYVYTILTEKTTLPELEIFKEKPEANQG